ncbi:MAG: aldose epimerase [Spirulinaceae cyanobacterium SM2_1_0]|nr:aldose epimerase [Spirulinaceae cyanobacterium SM2_1_0]
MPAIAVQENQYETYILTDESAQAQLSVVPERGGIITSWQVQGQEIFYLDAERFKDPTLSVRGGIPLLFPICGNLVGDAYTLDGKNYSLVQHGFARTSPWQVTQQATADGACLTVTLKSNEATRPVYPFEFELDYTYTLKGKTLELRQRHTNLSSQPMPFSTGIHPYFAIADKRQLTVTIPSDQYQIKGDATVQTFDGPFDFDQDEIDYAFINLTGQTATAFDAARQLKLSIHFDSHYSTLVFWAVKGKDFYCLEPWTGPRNALNTGHNLLIVAPGDSLETVISLTVEVG